MTYGGCDAISIFNDCNNVGKTCMHDKNIFESASSIARLIIIISIDIKKLSMEWKPTCGKAN